MGNPTLMILVLLDSPLHANAVGRLARRGALPVSPGFGAKAARSSANALAGGRMCRAFHNATLRASGRGQGKPGGDDLGTESNQGPKREAVPSAMKIGLWRIEG